MQMSSALVLTYTSGISSEHCILHVDKVKSVVGLGTDSKETQHDDTGGSHTVRPQNIE